MKLSCGIVIINSYGCVLGCKPHGKTHPFYDIPKGEIDNDENPYKCAIRETYEETGLDLSSVELIDCGVFDYMSNKRLHLFKCIFDIENFNILTCTSKYYNQTKKEYFPEVNSYRLINCNEIDVYFYPKLSPILKMII